MAEQPNQNPTQLMQTQVRLIEMSSRWTYNWDAEKATWVETANDVKVSDKFNQWAAKNNVNPVSHFITVAHQYSNGDKTLTVIYTLSASVIDRAQQAQMELAYREQVAKLAMALPSPRPVMQPDDSQLRTAQPLPTSAPPDPLQPVDVSSLGDRAPAPPFGAGDTFGAQSNG